MTRGYVWPLVAALGIAACSSGGGGSTDGGTSHEGGSDGGMIFSDDEVTVTDQNPALVRDVSQLGMNLRESDDIALDYGADKLSVLVYAEGDDARPPAATNILLSLKDPNGATVLAPSGSQDEYTSMGAPLRPSIDTGAASIVLPQTNQPAIPHGSYALRVSADGSVKVHIVTRRGTGAPPPGKLDVNLFLVEGCGVTKTDPIVDQTLAEMWKIFANADVMPGTVDRIDITGAEATQFVTPPASGEGKAAPLRQLTALASRAQNQRAVNAFIVKAFTNTPSLYGVSLGLPVALVVKTSTNAGTVTAIDTHRRMDMSINVPELGNTLAHEILHSMGLAHATEQTIVANPAFFHDLFADTIDCPASADMDMDGKLTQAECMAYDGANLMFWSGEGNVAISAGQKEIILRSPVIKRR